MTPGIMQGRYTAQERETFVELLTGERVRLCEECKDRAVHAQVIWKNGTEAFCSTHALQLLDKLPALAAAALGVHR